MSATETPDADDGAAAQAVRLCAARDLSRAGGLFLLRLGAGDISRVPSALIGRPVPQTVLRAAAGPRARRQAGARARSRRLQRRGDACSTSGRRGACPATTRRRCCSSSPPTSASAWSASTKDQPDNARRFLGRYGNPFVAVGVDPNGRASIEWGVYGVPETFVVGRDGRIAYKLIGPITRAQSRDRRCRPQIEKALAAAPSS